MARLQQVWTGLNRREQALAVLAALVGMAAAWIWLIHDPLTRQVEQAVARYDAGVASQAEYQRRMVEVARLRQAVARRRTEVAKLELNLAGGDWEPVWMRQLEQHLDRAGIVLVRAVAKTPVARQGLEEIEVTLETEGSYAGQVAFLRGLEETPWMGAVESLRLHGSAGGTVGASGAGGLPVRGEYRLRVIHDPQRPAPAAPGGGASPGGNTPAAPAPRGKKDLFAP